MRKNKSYTIECAILEHHKVLAKAREEAKEAICRKLTRPGTYVYMAKIIRTEAIERKS